MYHWALSAQFSFGGKLSKAKTMADRFFPNDMPNSVPETDDPSAAGAVGSSSSLLKLLSLPYSKTAERFLRAGLDLKEKVHLSLLLAISLLFLDTCFFICSLFPGRQGNVGSRRAPCQGFFALHWRARHGFLALEVVPSHRRSA